MLPEIRLRVVTVGSAALSLCLIVARGKKNTGQAYRERVKSTILLVDCMGLDSGFNPTREIDRLFVAVTVGSPHVTSLSTPAVRPSRATISLQAALENILETLQNPD